MIAADCVPFAYADFHSKLLRGKRVLIGCPKLDDLETYLEKLKVIIETAQPKSISVAMMEVPCCGGLLQAVQQAVKQSGSKLKVEVVVIGIDGEPRR